MPLALAAALVAGCASPVSRAPYDPIDDLPPRVDGLYRVRTTGIRATYLRQDVNLNPYDAVVIDPVTVSFEGEPRRSPNDRQARPDQLDPASLERLKQIFRESLERELAASEHYAVVAEPRIRTLRISGHLVNPILDLPTKGGRDRTSAISSGELTMVLNVRDGMTGLLLARLGDWRPVRPASRLSRVYETTPVRTWGSARDIASDWARVLRHLLEDLREPTDAPLPAAPGE